MRATATVLFTDVVGSTELRGRLGEEPADELRRKHDRLLTEAVEAYAGRVVKGLGDGIMATFAGASDAVAAAVAIQQGIDRLNRSGKTAVPIAVRVGLSAGDITFEEDDVHGTPVIEASRLCGEAVGGEILSSEIVRWLAGAQGPPSFVPVGSLELKGLATPVAAVRVEWEPAPASTIPMPALLTDVGRIFVGRDAELERLTQLWKEAVAGERRLTLLAGEPGVGKTRLAAELAMRAQDEGALVLAGRCDEDLGVPYQPFVEALRHFVGHMRQSQLRERLGRYGGELVRLLPELTERLLELPGPMRSDPQTERYRLFDAVAAWLGAASGEEPLLFVLDDIQWAAKPTLLLLRHVAASAELNRVLILATYRDTELGHDHPLVTLLADLRRHSSAERVSLLGLDSSGVAAFMAEAAGHSLAAHELALSRAIYEETEGNPFFVREVFRHLTETGAVEWQAERSGPRLPVEELGIPESVRDVIGRRLARLSDDTNQTLRIAAVVGTDFDIAVVEAAGWVGEEALLSSLDEATEARLITEVTSRHYRFAHALIRDTLYTELSATRRSAIHRRVAEAIEALYGDRLDDQLPALAHHYSQAELPDLDSGRAVNYAIRAGHRALEQLAYDEAVAYYSHALERLATVPRWEDEALRLELLIALGEAQRRTGDPAHRETLLEAARLAHARDDGGALARAALANCRGFLTSAVWAVDSDRIAVLEQALDGSAGRGSSRPRLLANLAMEIAYAGDFERRDLLSGEAVELARGRDDPATLAQVLIGRYNAIATTETLDERLQLTGELVELTRRLEDPALCSHVWFVRYRTVLEAGNIDEADRAIGSFTDLAVELNQPTLLWTAGWIKAGRHLLAGRLPEAEADMQRAYDIGEATGQADAAVFFQFQRYHLRFEQGRLGDLGHTWFDVMAHPGPVTKAMLALLHCELGRLGDACSAFEPLAASGFDMPRDNTHGHALTYCAAVCSSLGDRVAAQVLRERLAPFADQLPFPGGGIVPGCFAHHLGRLAATRGAWEEAEARFAAAVTTHQRIKAPTWLARTRLEWARMLLRRRQPGDTDQAVELLGHTLATAKELGLAKVERDAVALLR